MKGFKKFLLVAVIALIAATSFTACSACGEKTERRGEEAARAPTRRLFQRQQDGENGTASSHRAPQHQAHRRQSRFSFQKTRRRAGAQNREQPRALKAFYIGFAQSAAYLRGVRGNE